MPPPKKLTRIGAREMTIVSRAENAAGENASGTAGAVEVGEPDPWLERVPARLARDERRAVGIGHLIGTSRRGFSHSVDISD